MVCLDYRSCGPNGEPSVVHVDQESDYKITKLAESYEAFLLGLEGDEAFVVVEPDQAQVKSVWVDPKFAKKMGIDAPADGWIKRRNENLFRRLLRWFGRSS